MYRHYLKNAYVACLLGVALLLASGVVYRYYSTKWEYLLAETVKLPVPLSEFPLDVGSWQGHDVPMSETVKQIAGNDDFISRAYVHSQTKQTVYVYVAFSGRPRKMRGHRPQVCYKWAGWNNTSSEPVTIELIDGRLQEAMIHRFDRMIPVQQKTSVLNYYVVNGHVALTEESFTGMGFRAPNLQGNLAQYVAQVQITSEQDSAVLAAARDLCGSLYGFFPAVE